MGPKSQPGTRERTSGLRWSICLAVLALILAGSGVYYLLGRRAEPVQAAVPIVQSIADLASGAASGVQGGYQEGVPGGSYQLWKYRTDERAEGGTTYYYDQINECDSMTDDNAIRHQDPEDRHTPIYGFDAFGNYVIIGWEYCGDRNATNYDNNLGHDWNDSTKGGTGLNAAGLKSADPFLVIGVTTTGGAGIQSPILRMNLWIPKDRGGDDTIIIRAEQLCNHDSGWDLNGGADSSHISITLEGYKQGTTTRDPSLQVCPGDVTAWQPTFNLSSLGLDPLDRQVFTTVDALNQIKEASYERYEVTVETSKRNVGYTNQFRLRAAQPGNAYLGIGKTQIDPNSQDPSNALGVGMRLPDDNATRPGVAEYGLLRLQILWEANIYVAVDASRPCSDRGIEGRFGLYDTDHTAHPGNWAWSYPPSLEIFQADRASFLDGNNVSWSRDLDDSSNGGLTADDSDEGIFVFDDTAQNIWDTEVYERFRADKVYRFRFFNLGQRSWMQLGIPFGQANALQRCTEKPTFRLFHSDLSVGGLFGTGNQSKACQNDDLTQWGNDDLLANGPFDKKALGSPGSSGEYALYARGKVDSFYSGLERTRDPPKLESQVRRLTFASHHPHPPPQPLWGGKWDDRLRCMHNYWRRAEQMVETKLDRIELAVSDVDYHNLDKLYAPDTGTAIELAIQLPVASDLELKTTIYIDGDLLIQDDINNPNNSLPAGAFNQINQIYLIVSGDIFIDPDVTNIDAVLIAMPPNHKTDRPNLHAKGRIYTCYIDTTPPGRTLPLQKDPPVDLHDLEEILKTKTEPLRDLENRAYANACNKKLIVNGALIARQIHLGRTIDLSVSPADIVREEINLLPEYFIGIPLLPAHTDWFYGTDSILILPVNF